ncbi:MAG: metallophosphoesterase family protein, partial [bacterium]
RDDGVVVFLNGTEVFRSNMPTGTVTYTTFASVALDVPAESTPVAAGAEAGLLVEGMNVVAVEIHQANLTSSDISFNLELRAGPPVVTRGPYLQDGTTSGVVIRWRTDQPTNSRVRFGTSRDDLSGIVDNATMTREHIVAVVGLEADTKYYYSIGSSASRLAGGDANHFFRTSPLAGRDKPTRVWVLGDSGTANANARAVRDAYRNFAASRPADLMLMLGDNAYTNGTDQEYQAAVFDMYTTAMMQAVLWPTLGNHDALSAYSTTQSGVYYDIFTLPKNGEAGGLASGTEAYYSFDYANIHFICLDSQDTNRSPTGAMMMWLENDLASTAQDWVVAYFHHPPYTKGSHDSDSLTDSGGRMVEMRENVLPVLEAGGVDLVLTGHSHSYERSYLLDGHYGYSTALTPQMKLNSGDGREDGDGAYAKPEGGPAAHAGAVYVVAGSSGQTSGGTLNHPAMYISWNKLGSLILDVQGNRFDAKFIDNTTAVQDYFTMIKGSGARTTTIWVVD